MGNTPKLANIQLTPEVIDALNGELAYQATLPPSGRADTIDHGVAGQLVTLQEYTSKAIHAWVHNPGDEQALDVLRKCAATVIRALITYGCPRREGY